MYCETIRLPEHVAKASSVFILGSEHGPSQGTLREQIPVESNAAAVVELAGLYGMSAAAVVAEQQIANAEVRLGKRHPP